MVDFIPILPHIASWNLRKWNAEMVWRSIWLQVKSVVPIPQVVDSIPTIPSHDGKPVLNRWGQRQIWEGTTLRPWHLVCRQRSAVRTTGAFGEISSRNGKTRSRDIYDDQIWLSMDNYIMNIMNMHSSMSIIWMNFDGLPCQNRNLTNKNLDSTSKWTWVSIQNGNIPKKWNMTAYHVFLVRWYHHLLMICR